MRVHKTQLELLTIRLRHPTRVFHIQRCVRLVILPGEDADRVRMFRGPGRLPVAGNFTGERCTCTRPDHDHRRDHGHKNRLPWQHFAAPPIEPLVSGRLCSETTADGAAGQALGNHEPPDGSLAALTPAQAARSGYRPLAASFICFCAAAARFASSRSARAFTTTSAVAMTRYFTSLTPH